MKQKIFSLLVLLIVAVSGAWSKPVVISDRDFTLTADVNPTGKCTTAFYIRKDNEWALATTANEGDQVKFQVNDLDEGWHAAEAYGSWTTNMSNAAARAKRAPANNDTQLDVLGEIAMSKVDGENAWTFTMKAANAEIYAYLVQEHAIVFYPTEVSANHLTVTVNGTDVTANIDVDGKLKPVFEDDEVVVTTAAGYEFTSVVATLENSTTEVGMSTNAVPQLANATEASMTMPDKNVDVVYTVVRNINYEDDNNQPTVVATVDPASIIVVKDPDHQGSYKLASGEEASTIVSVTDKHHLNAINQVSERTLTFGTDYDAVVEEKGDNDSYTEVGLLGDFNLAPGTYRIRVVGHDGYAGVVYTNDFVLYEEFTLTFDPADVAANHVTVKLNDTETTVANGKLEHLVNGDVVTMNTAAGYKFYIDAVTPMTSEISVTIDDADETVTYRVLRDMEYEDDNNQPTVVATVDPDRIIVVKDPDHQGSYKLASGDDASTIVSVTDKHHLDANNQVGEQTLTDGTDYFAYVEEKGDNDSYTEVGLLGDFNLAPGTYRIRVVGNDGYAGAVYTNDFTLYEEFTLTFDPADVAANHVTVKLNDTETTVTNGKLEHLVNGDVVTMTTAAGYKFYDATVIPLPGEMSVTIDDADETVTYQVVRDMGYRDGDNQPTMTATVNPDRIRVVKDGQGKYHFQDGKTLGDYLTVSDLLNADAELQLGVHYSLTVTYFDALGIQNVVDYAGFDFEPRQGYRFLVTGLPGNDYYGSVASNAFELYSTIPLTEDMITVGFEVDGDGQPIDPVYTGDPIEPTIVVKDKDGHELTEGEDYEVEYENNINARDKGDDNPPTIIVKGKGEYEGEIDIAFTILKADAKVTEDPVALNPNYNKKMQNLITAGKAYGGTLEYKLGENGTYSTEIPQAKDMGDYTIYYHVVGAENFNDSPEYQVVSKIGGRTRDLWDLIKEAQRYLAWMKTLDPQTTKLRAAEKTLETAINAAIVVCLGDNMSDTRIRAAKKTLTTALNAAKVEGGKVGGKIPDDFPWEAPYTYAPASSFNFASEIDELEVEPVDAPVNTVWFDLNGRRLECEPVRKGIYIQNGRKVVIK